MTVLSFALLSMSGSAFAQTDTGPDPSLPIPSLKYDRPPPDYSWEIGVHASYGEVAYWKQEIAPWVGFGLRIGWGRNIPDTYAHRVGITTLVYAEGPMPIHMSLGVDPQLSWDYIGKSGLWLGAGVGGGFALHSKSVQARSEQAFGVAPSASVRIGWSQSWTRVGRRLFTGVEVRTRAANGNLGTQVALVLGSGKGY